MVGPIGAECIAVVAIWAHPALNTLPPAFVSLPVSLLVSDHSYTAWFSSFSAGGQGTDARVHGKLRQLNSTGWGRLRRHRQGRVKT